MKVSPTYQAFGRVAELVKRYGTQSEWKELNHHNAGSNPASPTNLNKFTNMDNMTNAQLNEATKLINTLRAKIKRKFEVIHFAHTQNLRGNTEVYRLSIDIDGRIYFVYGKNFNEVVNKMAAEVKNPKNYPDAVSAQGDTINSILTSYYTA